MLKAKNGLECQGLEGGGEYVCLRTMGAMEGV